MKDFKDHQITKYILNTMEKEDVSKIKITEKDISFKKQGFVERRNHGFTKEEFTKYIEDYMNFNFEDKAHPLAIRYFYINDQELLHYCFMEAFICGKDDFQDQLIITKRKK